MQFGMACATLVLDPAPVTDLPESPELVSEVVGTVVVAQGDDYVSAISLPGGATSRIPIPGPVTAASAIDESGRIAYVKRSALLKRSQFDEHQAPHFLFVRSLRTGDERSLGEVAPLPRWQRNCLWLEANRVLYGPSPFGPRLFDLGSGEELDLEGWDAEIQPTGLTADGTAILGERTEIRPDGSRVFGVVVVVDVGSRVVTSPPTLPLPGPDDRHSEPRLPASSTYERVYVDERHAIYEGLATASSKPRRWFGLGAPSFERSVRVCDIETARTVTLVPRFGLGTFAFSPHPLPPIAGADPRRR